MTYATLRYIDTFKVMGIQVRTLNTNEFDPATAKIPALWQKFFVRFLPATDSDQKNIAPEIYGVYFDYESDHQGNYSLLAGIKTLDTTLPTAESVTISVQGGTYLVFEAQGAMPEALISTWEQIWTYFDAPNCPFQRAYTTDFEQYLAADKVSVHIAVNSPI